MTNEQHRQRAIEAAKVLNNLLGDLIAGTRSFEIFGTKFFIEQLGQTSNGVLTRMSISYTVLALAKWLEFYRLYGRQIPASLRARARTLAKDLEGRGVREFRNQVVGHIWDDKHQRPLTDKEVLGRLSTIVGRDVVEFMRWVNKPNQNTLESSVVGFVESTRDHILSEHDLTWTEIFDST